MDIEAERNLFDSWYQNHWPTCFEMIKNNRASEDMINSYHSSQGGWEARAVLDVPLQQTIFNTAQLEKAYDEIQKMIRPGVLSGSGCDDTATRNGIILASNVIASMICDAAGENLTPAMSDEEILKIWSETPFADTESGALLFAHALLSKVKI